MQLPEIPNNATADLELSSDKNFYIVKKTGFYNINSRLTILVKTDASDQFDGSFGGVGIAIAVRTHKDDENTGVTLDQNKKYIFKGAKTPKYRDNITEEEVKNAVNPIYTINTSGNIFISKGGRIGIQVQTDGAPSISENRNNISINPKVAPDGTKAPSYISIYRNL
ncbi:MAG: hypothetical protein Q4A00_01665 [Flavobacteriaceae bacterium]|nr:hypothetical protein [Flavobacteriaceae bacterium]